MADYVNHGDDRELSAREPEDRIGSLEGGDYVVELMASRGVRLTGSNSGAVLLWFTIRFLDGPRRGRELRMSIIVDGPPAMSLGGPEGFFEPLKRGLGLAARSSAAEPEIVGFVDGLLAHRADRGRRASYGPNWVLKAIRKFRDADRRVDTEIATLRNSLIHK